MRSLKFCPLYFLNFALVSWTPPGKIVAGSRPFIRGLMKKTLRPLIICTVLAVVGLCLWLVVRHRGPYEPVYQGKRLGYWLKIDARAGATLDDRIAAEAAFRALDTNAVPFLVARLESDALWASRKAEFNSLVDKWHLPANLKLTSAPGFNSTVQAISFLGKSAAPGLLRVFDQTSNTNVLNAAAQTLYACEGLGFGGNFAKALFNQPHDDPVTWGQFVTEQRDKISPTAWQRLNSAQVSQWRR